MKRGLRLVDAVAIAALGLLALKLVGVLSPAAEEAPGFARVLSHARTNYVPPEVLATGSVPEKADAAKAAAAPPSQPPAPKPPAFEPVPLPVSPSERQILERLGERRDELQQRSRDLETRERLIENAEKKLEARVNELKGLEDKAETAAKRADPADAALRNLVTMYETMKPKEAARVFDRLPQDVLMSVVLQMNPRKMADVLAAMTPEAAEKLTVALAQRARDPSSRAASAAALPANELPAIDAPPAAPARPRR
ncbi:MAG TPA: hypothetical protein VIL65_16520 [Beijerinckiaceae bacterium]|jgi:flagellar motility protein MotE (MotC chaperone)